MSLDKFYYDPKHAAGYGSVSKLVETNKHKKMNVEEWLSGQNTYTLQNLFVKISSYTVTRIDDVWVMDLADLCSLKFLAFILAPQTC